MSFSYRRGIRIAAAASFVVVLAAGCFNPPVDPNGNCKLAGTCECTTKADCAPDLDCVNGHCATLVIDAGPFAGELGAACASDADCNSGICLPPGPGRSSVCTQHCNEESLCPGTWECKASFFPDAGVSYLCAPPYNALCLPCTKDSDCGAVGDLCIQVNGQNVCGKDCTTSDCPSNYACEGISDDDGGTRGNQCMPVSFTCDCSDLSAGMGRGCRNQNALGTCYGYETCQANGLWSGCDAPAASKEICDGLDNDCNGLIDSNDPSIDFSSLPKSPAFPSCVNGTSGTCVGTWACTEQDGGFAWTCGAKSPQPELCNGLDEDCNGGIDEPFRNAQGKYVDDHNCGACGYDCDLAVENLAPDGADAGAVSCELRGVTPTCVPKQCAQGFAPYPPDAPVMCLRAVGSSCRACTVDADCGPFGDRCVSLEGDTGTWCAQACDVDAPYPGCTGAVGQQGCCPTGYTCEQQGGDKLCIPEGDSCTCKPSRAGATRSCLVNLSQASCLGIETCGMTGEWGVCDTSTTTVELCDNADNNCDGQVDELFKNTRGSGTWDTDDHCGSCQNNCIAQWSPTIQHAIGGCDAGVAIAPTCQIVKCTQETIAGGGACQLDGDCGAGRLCHPLYHQCVASCSSATDCNGDPCVNGFCTAACMSDSDCVSRFGAPSTCSNGTCSVNYQFVNADKESTNGCECPAAAGVTDEPDLYTSYPDAGAPYVDRDCDLVDGVAATSLFVRAGTGLGNGTRSAPYTSISTAISAFNPAVHSAILVAAGSYVEQVVLKNGVKIYGGYSSDFSRRDVVAYPTLIEGPEPNFASTTFKRGAVNAETITSNTVLAGFTIRGYDVTFKPAAGRPGINSYAVYVRDSSNALTLANNHLVGGRGGDAPQGLPGAAGAIGGAGADGLDSVECTTTDCANDSQSGGAGGVNLSCSTANGNGGASASGSLVSSLSPQGYQPPVGKNGQGGAEGRYLHDATVPSQANLCKYDCQIAFGGMNGGVAQNGTDGTAGIAGAGCMGTLGIISGLDWVGGGGGGGSPGSNGSGGGGGGAGGGVKNENPPGCTVGNRVGDLGGTGGGGGAGGCGGKAGNGGGAGGGSFALFVVFSTAPTSVPVIEGNIIEPGAGGRGGNGGPGGYGGAGGQGGEGGVAQLPAWCAGLGGHGGRGGNGGAGSGGGGGCGGAVYGVAGNFLASSNYASKNAIAAPSPSAAGSPGAGGASPGGPAAAGSSGQPGQTGTFKSF